VSAASFADRRPWTLQALIALPQQGQITRHICIEGWSQIGQLSGVPLGAFLRRVGADLSAHYVYFKCFRWLFVPVGQGGQQPVKLNSA
jgi:DMSO/TMAO reductase YedYZ molybdopterin-dependent catalytic subunit